MPEHNAPNNEELWKFVQGLNDRVSVLEHRYGYVSSAFRKNDLDKPDYDGHRRDHIQIHEDQKVVSDYKIGVTKTVLTIIVTAIVSVLAAGLLQTLGRGP